MNQLRPASLLRRFIRNDHAAIIVVFGLALIPVGVATGVAIDFGRALRLQTHMRAALDLSVLSAVHRPQASRIAFAAAAYSAQMQDGAGAAPTFSHEADGSLKGVATAAMPTHILRLINRNTIDISVSARASIPANDDSCILALGQGKSVTDNAITLNGAPKLDLTGCTLRSNVSMKCNGHNGNAEGAIAAGNSTNCSNPQSNAPVVPDIHAALATNIRKECGLTSYNISWTAGTPPSSPQMITQVHGDVTYYHVCGNVTAKSVGTLIGSTTADSVLIIENGSLTLDRNASITLERTTLVFSGTASGASHQINFPQGKGHAASLTVTPGTASGNPWQGVAIYQDPAITTNVNMSWGPGATLNADGLLYFPNASLTLSGVAQSQSGDCSKLVVNELTSNGAVGLRQTDAGCSSIGLKQHKSAPRLMN